MARLALDIECNGLKPDKIFLVAVKNLDDNTIGIFKDASALKDYFDVSPPSLVVVHNGIDFDLHWLQVLWGITLPREIIRDTLVLSRLLNQRLEGGHSLEAWGERLGLPKGTVKDFSEYTQELEEYCIQDVQITHKLWSHLVGKMSNPTWRRSIQVEHEMSFICKEMELNGFNFNRPRADELYREIEARIKDLDVLILKEFPPVLKLNKIVPRRYKKDGSLHAYSAQLQDKANLGPFDYPNMVVRFDGEAYHVYSWEDFNSGSSKQIQERLHGFWKPFEKTEAHLLAVKQRDTKKLEYFEKYGWKTTEANLGTLSEDAPQAARLLVERILLGSRLRTLTTWIEAYERTNDGKLHARFDTLGTWTHRLSHSNPNLGNVSAEKTIKYKTEAMRKLAIHYGGEFRKLFNASPDSFLVGTDMEGAHLRLFAHLINDKELADALVKGDKSRGTDAHSLNKRKLGAICPDRDLAKTFIFAYLNGGGASKVSEIFRCSVEQARQTLQEFQRAYPGLDLLRNSRIPEDAAKGYFKGLDGRLVPCDSEHLMVAGYLQNGEAVVMKHANVLWQRELRKLGIQFRQVNLVHDEFQTEVLGDEQVAHKVGQVQSEAIEQVGLNLGITCPLSGEYKIGYDWLQTH